MSRLPVPIRLFVLFMISVVIVVVWNGIQGNGLNTLSNDIERSLSGVFNALQPVPGGGTITFGEPARGTIFSGERDVWTFTGERGTTITVTSDANFDSYLELQDSDGRVLTENDDGGEGLNAEICAYTLPFNGPYQLIMRGYSSSGSGTYTVNLLNSSNTTAAIPIVYGDEVEGVTGGCGGVVYTFNGYEDEDIVIEMSIPNGDALLTLSDEMGRQLARDDDSGGSRDALIRYQITEDGVYYINAQSYILNPGIEFTLSLRKGE